MASEEEFELFTSCGQIRKKYGCLLFTQKTLLKTSLLTFSGKSKMRSIARAARGRDIGREILDGLRELKRRKVGRIRSLPAISDIRTRTGLSQTEFAALLGVSVRTLQEWEQGRRNPSGAARTLLTIAARNPGALLDVA